MQINNISNGIYIIIVISAVAPFHTDDQLQVREQHDWDNNKYKAIFRYLLLLSL